MGAPPLLASLLLLALAPSPSRSAPFSIDAFGAVAGLDTHAQALLNGAAFAAALSAANASSSVGDSRAVLVPADRVYSFLPAVQTFGRVSDVVVYIEGALNLSTANLTLFPGWPNPYAMLDFTGCRNLTLVSETGRGLVNGRGNAWWWYTLLVADHRNNLLHTSLCTDMTLRGLSFLNAPQYHVLLDGAVNVEVSGVTVLVDIDDQLDVYRYIGAVAKPRDAGAAGPAEATGCKIQWPA